MTPDGNGKFCGNCNKTVTDFSTFTDKELHEYLSKGKGTGCGRFENSQLNRLMVTNNPSDTPVFRRILFGTALAAGVTGTAYSQNNKEVIPTGTIDSSGHATEIVIIRKYKTPVEGYIQIKGKVTDKKTGIPLENVAVNLTIGTYNVSGAYTDSTGTYSIMVPSTYTNQRATITTECRYYKSTSKKLSLNESSTEINMKLKRRRHHHRYTKGCYSF